MHSDFVLNLSLSIVDRDSLWQAAATALAAVAPSLSDEDIADTLGPREAPSLADCLTILLLPSSLPGGIVQQFSCVPAAIETPSGTKNRKRAGRDIDGFSRPVVDTPLPMARVIGM